MSTSYRFPNDFAWGVATAAYQIEGAAQEGGRKPSVWDVLRTRTGETGAIANDHYHRFESDLDLMASLGIRHYRMSIAWPRIIPDGRGAVNEAGVDFYKRLFDAMQKRGITPYVTLYHWDHPLALEQRYGGFRSREMADDMATYAGEVVKRFGDRVTNWFTMNEIPCATMHSYAAGEVTFDTHAPRQSLGSQKAVNQTIYHAVLAHGRMVQAIRAASPQKCRVALVDNTGVTVPLTESPADIDAAKKAFQVHYGNGQIIVPALTGGWSPRWEARARAAGELPDSRPGDFEVMRQPLDAVGLNIYSGVTVRAANNADGFEVVPYAQGYPRMAMPWLQLMPEAIYWSQRLIRDTCGFQGDFYITENGCAADDWLTPQGEILDNDRIHFLRQYLRQLHRGVDEGLPTKGYFLWSFMDNFEWTWGYTKRFGIVWNSYETQTRIPKASAHWYAEVIRQNRVV